MDNEPVADPTDTRMVDFYGDEIPVVRLADGRLYVPLRPITDALGLDYASQSRRVRADDVMSEDAVLVRVVLPGAGIREMLAIPLEQLPGYLFGIDAKRVKVELRNKVIRYKREVFAVILRAVTGGELTVPALPAPPLSGELTTAQQTLQMITAMQSLAQEQVELEQRVGTVEDKQQTMATYMRTFVETAREQLRDHEQRLGLVEDQVAPEAHIDRSQQRQVSGAVKEIAYALGGNYAQVYGALYREFDISAYGELPRSRFDEAIGWLRAWYDRVDKGSK